jgi:hypothetical protein
MKGVAAGRDPFQIVARNSRTGGTAEPPVGGLQLRKILQEVRRNLLAMSNNLRRNLLEGGGWQLRTILQEVRRNLLAMSNNLRRNLLEAECSSVKSYRRYGGTSGRRSARSNNRGTVEPPGGWSAAP